MNIGSKWVSTDSKEFIVDDVYFKTEETWVSYHNKETKQQYNCLVEAFKYRFREVLNEKRN